MLIKSLPKNGKVRLLNYWTRRVEEMGEVSVVEATQLTRTLCRLAGVSMFDMVVLPDGRIQVKPWCPLGVLCAVAFISLFAWCTYYSTVHRQTIVLGVIYDSILDHYGEHVKSVMFCFLVFYVSITLSFTKKDKTEFWKHLLEIDGRLREIGVRVNCSKLKLMLRAVSCVHFSTTVLLSALLYFVLSAWDVEMPLCKIFQLMYTINLTMHCLIVYLFSALIMQDRYRYLNLLLSSVLSGTDGSVGVLAPRTEVARKEVSLSREKVAIETINQVQTFYSLVNRIDKANGKKFGNLILVIICISFVSIILHIFYLMEATARGLYQDYRKYLFFFGYNALQIYFAAIVIYFIVYACERVYSETSKTAGIAHDIMHEQISKAVTREASLLSMQLLHQQHKYTANGLFELDKSLLLSVLGCVTTYLIILLQFATTSSMEFKDINLINNTSHRT